jgi:plasmid maintenance system antidote protein VapI
MKTTLELVDAALAKTELSERALSTKLGMAPTNIAMARQRGTVSPLVAGQLAALLDLNVEHWIAVAVLESAPKSRMTDQLRRVLHAIA